MRVHIGDVETCRIATGDRRQLEKVIIEAAEAFSAYEDAEERIALGEDATMETELVLDELADVIMAASGFIGSIGIDEFEPYIKACEDCQRERGRM